MKHLSKTKQDYSKFVLADKVQKKKKKKYKITYSPLKKYTNCHQVT